MKIEIENSLIERVKLVYKVDKDEMVKMIHKLIEKGMFDAEYDYVANRLLKLVYS